MPPVYDHSMTTSPSEKLSTPKNILQISLDLKDEKKLKELCVMIDHYEQEKVSTIVK